MQCAKRSQQIITLECDKDESKAEFTIRPLTNGESMYIRDRVTSIDGDNVAFKVGTSQLLLVAFGLIDVNGFIDEDGKELKPEFTKDGRFTRLTNGWLDLLPANALDELAVKIQDLTSLTEVQVKDLQTFREVDNG